MVAGVADASHYLGEELVLDVHAPVLGIRRFVGSGAAIHSTDETAAVFDDAGDPTARIVDDVMFRGEIQAG
jgi:hypothetical protein